MNKKEKPLHADTLLEAHQAIRAQREAWSALSPEERARRARQTLQDEQEAQEKKALVSEDALQASLKGIQEMAKGAQVMSPAQEKEYRWEHSIKPDMRAHGWQPEHIKRITRWDNDRQERAFESTRELCRMRGAIVLLAGERGAGKTTVCAQIMLGRLEEWEAWHLLEPAQRTGKAPLEVGRYEKLGTLAAMFKSQYADFGSINSGRLAGLFENWCTTPFLALDEIHESEDLKTQMRFLTDLCDRRYANRVDTVLISNRSATDCQSMLSASIISRITQSGRIIPCEWGSWRAKIGKANG